MTVQYSHDPCVQILYHKDCWSLVLFTNVLYCLLGRGTRKIDSEALEVHLTI